MTLKNVAEKIEEAPKVVGGVGEEVGGVRGVVVVVVVVGGNCPS